MRGNHFAMSCFEILFFYFVFFNNPRAFKRLFDLLPLLAEFIKAGDSRSLAQLHLSISHKTVVFQLNFVRLVLLHEAKHLLLLQPVRT